jgi:hypothetical protein
MESSLQRMFWSGVVMVLLLSKSNQRWTSRSNTFPTWPSCYTFFGSAGLREAHLGDGRESLNAQLLTLIAAKESS